MKRKTWKAESAETLEASVRRVLGEAYLPLIAKGAVYLDGKRTPLPATRLKVGQTVMAVLEEAGRSTLGEVKAPAPLAVLYEDADLVAVDKPAGINTQPSPGASEESLLDQVSTYLKHPADLVHRLDRETSGVIVFGKRPEATTALAQAFREGTARKRYLAAVGPGLPPAGTIERPLAKDPSRPGRYRTVDPGQGVYALTEFLRFYDGPFGLVSLWPKTGRTHQLRAHLRSLGCPILGDRRYGGLAEVRVGEEAQVYRITRCLLHAEQLVLPHPTAGTYWTLKAPIPRDLGQFFAVAKIDPSSALLDAEQR